MIKSIQWIADHGLQHNTFFSLTAIWPETKLARQFGINAKDFEPCVDKSPLENKGLFFFKPGNPIIENYFSNCSGTYHFITEKQAIDIKYYLIDTGFCNRFKAKTFKGS